jgi:hypothetical protein
MSVADTNSAMDFFGSHPFAFARSQTEKHRKLLSAARPNGERSTPSRPYPPDFIRPMSIFLIALAAAVTMWGFAYKLSLYEQPQRHSSHLPVVKMWLGPERQPGMITSNFTKPHSDPAPTLQCDMTIGAMPPINSRQARWMLPETVFVPIESLFLIGSRSPPSRVQPMRSRVVA